MSDNRINDNGSDAEGVSQNGNTCSENGNNSQSENVRFGADESSVQSESVTHDAVRMLHRSNRLQLDGRDSIFAVLFLVFSVVASVITDGIGLGMTVSHSLFLVLSTAYCASKGIKLKLFPLFCGVISLAAGVLFALRLDFTVSCLLIPAVLALDCVYLQYIWGAPKYELRDFTMLFDVIAAFCRPLLHLVEPFRALLSGRSVKSKRVGKAVAGICLALPLVCLLGVLLSRSDAAFQGLLERLFSDVDWSFSDVLVGLLLFAPVFSFVLLIRKKRRELSLRTGEKLRFIDSTVLNTVLVCVSVLYVVYMVSLLSYFFSAFSGLLPEGFSYAQYARRGFFEICGISAINIAIVFISLACVKLRDGKHPLPTRILSLFICLFSLLLIATAISKMAMYIGQYGMTRLRVLTSCIMVFLAVAFVAAIVRVFSRRFPYMKLIIAAAAAVLITVSVGDVDSTIARYNIDTYLSGEAQELDVYSLCCLGASATPQLVRLCELEALDEESRNCINDSLADRMERHGICERVYDENSGEVTLVMTSASEEQSIGSFNLALRDEKKALAGVADSVIREINQRQEPKLNEVSY